jgi:hypothetical protein
VAQRSRPDIEQEATLTPAECRFLLDFIRSLFRDWTLGAYPNFDPEYVKGVDPERYWKLMDFGWQVERIERPVRAEWFAWLLTEYARSCNEVLMVGRNAPPEV